MHTEQYQVGQVLYNDRSHAILMSPNSVAALAVGVTRQIPAQQFVGQAYHESGYAINEIDTDLVGGVPTKSYGLLQINDEEYRQIPGYTPVRLEPWNDIRVFALLCSRRADDIHTWSKGRLARDTDLWAYIGLYHNEGGGACKKTIENYGCDAVEYARRNWADITARVAALGFGNHPGLSPSSADIVFHNLLIQVQARDSAVGSELDRVRRITRYMQSCIDGGPRWKEVTL